MRGQNLCGREGLVKKKPHPPYPLHPIDRSGGGARTGGKGLQPRLLEWPYYMHHIPMLPGDPVLLLWLFSDKKEKGRAS